MDHTHYLMEVARNQNANKFAHVLTDRRRSAEACAELSACCADSKLSLNLIHNISSHLHHHTQLHTDRSNLVSSSSSTLMLSSSSSSSLSSSSSSTLLSSTCRSLRRSMAKINLIRRLGSKMTGHSTVSAVDADAASTHTIAASDQGESIISTCEEHITTELPAYFMQRIQLQNLIPKSTSSTSSLLTVTSTASSKGAYKTTRARTSTHMSRGRQHQEVSGVTTASAQMHRRVALATAAAAATVAVANANSVAPNATVLTFNVDFASTPKKLIPRASTPNKQKAPVTPITNTNGTKTPVVSRRRTAAFKYSSSTPVQSEPSSATRLSMGAQPFSSTVIDMRELLLETKCRSSRASSAQRSVKMPPPLLASSFKKTSLVDQHRPEQLRQRSRTTDILPLSSTNKLTKKRSRSRALRRDKRSMRQQMEPAHKRYRSAMTAAVASYDEHNSQLGACSSCCCGSDDRTMVATTNCKRAASAIAIKCQSTSECTTATKEDCEQCRYARKQLRRQKRQQLEKQQNKRHKQQIRTVQPNVNCVTASVKITTAATRKNSCSSSGAVRKSSKRPLLSRLSSLQYPIKYFPHVKSQDIDRLNLAEDYICYEPISTTRHQLSDRREQPELKIWLL